MQEQNYVQDRDFAFEVREGKGASDVDRVVEEAIQLRPDVILAPATLEAVAAKRATSTIPIVCGALAYAVDLDLIGSEARPGGNVTGIEPTSADYLRSRSTLRMKCCLPRQTRAAYE